MAKAYLLTGLSGSGKTTLSREIFNKNRHLFPILVLDGDEIRSSLNMDLDFSEADRLENIRRCGEIAKIAIRQGITVLLALIAPYDHGRQLLQHILGNSLEIIYVECPLKECQKRDPKGNYKKILMGELKNYTGIDDRYEIPQNYSLKLNTHTLTVEEATNICSKFILENNALFAYK